MSEKKVYTAIGLMSGTSADGVDAALIETDGQGFVKPLESLSMPYDERVREKIRKCFGLRAADHPDAAEAERVVTLRHAAAVVELLAKAGLQPEAVDVIGFHGQTITHIPEEKLTWQLGDGETLARQCKIDVVNDFRSADVQAGGQGAPFLPLYHQARARAEGLLEQAGGPVAVLNVGGVSNVTWIGAGEEEVLAFDSGPGNALMDDYIFNYSGAAFDENGAMAEKGTVAQDIVDSWMALPYFARPLPKSLDRNDWDVSAIEYLDPADAMATLAQFTVDAIKMAERLLPTPPRLWMVTGGGRKNAHLMGGLSGALNGDVRDIDEFGWNGDSVEAEGFAYLAVRSLLGLPLSLPSTTGVPAPMPGGKINKAA